MNFWKQGLVVLVAVTFILGIGLPQASHAAAKKASSSPSASSAGKDSRDIQKISTDPDSATIHENALLKWGPVNPPYRGKRAEYFVRGAFLEAQEVEGSPGTFKIKILPVEVVENEYRFITFDSFKNGVEFELFLGKAQQKLLKKGNMIEFKQWYETQDAGGQGYARLINFLLHQDFVPYPATAAAYLKKPGLEWEQYANAIKAVQLANQKPSEQEVKDMLDALASSGSNPEIKTIAATALSDWFSAQPTGKPLPAATTAATTKPEVTAAKKKAAQ